MKNLQTAPKWAWNTIGLFSMLTIFSLRVCTAQELSISKLDELLNSLAERNEAMGSLTLAKNGKVIYSRAIGYRYITENKKVPADTKTKYRIWSITKMYTATMILQLIEEGKFQLETPLSEFFPEIPNAKIVTIREMLGHRSGIHDFAEPDTGGQSTSNDQTQAGMVKKMAGFKSDFTPGDKFRYSNSNYLLLGYIIERIDSVPYGTALFSRISSRIGLSDTYFGAGSLDGVENKSYSYRFDGKWIDVPEGDFSGLIPAGAGGIVSTPTDMTKFIESLFACKLIGKNSLMLMTEIEDFYGLGIFAMPYMQSTGFGHTGGYIASHSSLAYYPNDSLAIAYCTNGHVYRMENILNHVLSIYHNKPFGISLNRYLVAVLTILLGVSVIMLIRFRAKSSFSVNLWVSFGMIIPILFWLSTVTGGYIYGDYNLVRLPVNLLDSFYSRSGTFMATAEVLIALFSIFFFASLCKVSKEMNISPIPLIPILGVVLSMCGISLFPEPDPLYPFFANVIISIILGPLLAIILWKEKAFSQLRELSGISLAIMLLPLILILARPLTAGFLNSYFGIVQRLLHLGWSLWFVSLFFCFAKLIQKRNLLKIRKY